MSNLTPRKTSNEHHVSFWLGEERINALYDLESMDKESPEFVNMLRNVMNSMTDFSKIVTHREIPVSFSSGNKSYTDGQQIIISADINPDSLDSTVGLVLHESAHCKLSGKLIHYTKSLESNWMWAETTKGSTMHTDAQRLGMTLPQLRNLVHLMLNYLEDRRIDLWMYQNYKGYQAYYTALYDKYWHCEEIDNALRDPAYHKPYLDYYEFFVINMTNKYCDLSALPELDKIYEIADLTEKGLEALGDSDPAWAVGTTPLIMKKAIAMAEIVLRNSLAKKDPDPPKSTGERPQKKNILGLENLDFAPSGMEGETLYVDVDSDAFQEALAQQKDLILTNGAGKKFHLSSEVLDELNTMHNTKAKIVYVNGDFIAPNVKCPIVVYRKVSRNAAQNGKVPMMSKYPYNKDAVSAGIRMGQVLAHKLRVMQESNIVKHTRKQHGRIDARLIATLGFNNQDVFYESHVESHEPVDVWIDIDGSGSMQGDKLSNAIKLAVAIASAASKNKLLNCTIAVRDAGHHSNNLVILYDSRIDNITKIGHIMPYVTAGGGTPEGLCFAAMKEEILNLPKNNRKYFINLSDGEPATSFDYKGTSYKYSGETAFAHTKAIMNEFRNHGINVMSYFISQSENSHGMENFKKMYGNDAKFIKSNDILGIARTLNNLFLEK